MVAIAAILATSSADNSVWITIEPWWWSRRSSSPGRVVKQWWLAVVMSISQAAVAVMISHRGTRDRTYISSVSLTKEIWVPNFSTYGVGGVFFLM
jgi:hypothetical protein